jgi:hypothetical protein
MVDGVKGEVFMLLVDLFSGLISQDILVLGHISQDILITDLTSLEELDILNGNIDEGVNNK